VKGARARAYAAWQALESRLDRAFGAASNPLRRLGALAFLLFWVVAVTGIYLYVFLDTSVAGAWESVKAIDRDHWVLGRLMRGMHRYGADALLVVTFAHTLREYLARHEHGFRWFSWVTGVPLVVLLYASGIGGYWLVWDQLSLFSATATAEWFDGLGVALEPFARNFLVQDLVVDRLFTLFIFLHIGIPLAFLLGMWVHVQRVSRPDTWPSRELAAGTLVSLAALALILPVQSQPQADLARVPGTLALDWFFLFPHPLMYATSPVALWWMAAGAVLLLLALPLLSRAPRLPVAVVSPQDCNGCGRCFVDCPYSAIALVPHPDKANAPRMAQVKSELCAGCGICAGACPSSTPFRSSTTFASGIDMPGREIVALRAELEAALQREKPCIVVFGCDYGTDVRAVRAPGVVALNLICAAMLPPSFIEYAVRNGALGVLVTGCAPGGCEYRFGQRWLEERLAGTREPYLRANVPRERVRVTWVGGESLPALQREIARFRADVVDGDQRKGQRSAV
jgi:coenzyme F420-reducing hydrogenase delta subunit/Pyruvate/2-oxoacid:ferredoxin oxidoreductase delta subunit